MILLTGVTGKTGGATADALLKKGVKFRALVRSVKKAAALKDQGVELVAGDVADHRSLERALEGITKALLVLPNTERQFELETQFTDAAVKAKVKHLVKMSSMEATAGAKTPIPRMHYASEQHIQQSGLDWTLIKPNFFMQNLLGSAKTIREQGKILLPMGNGKTGMADIRDIGAVTAEALTGTGHENKRYEITGPELLSFYDVADRFTAVLGRKIEYVPVPLPNFKEGLSRVLTSVWHVNAVAALLGEIAEGGLTGLTDTVQQVLGRPPISLEQFIRDNQAVYTA